MTDVCTVGLIRLCPPETVMNDTVVRCFMILLVVDEDATLCFMPPFLVRVGSFGPFLNLLSLCDRVLGFMS